MKSMGTSRMPLARPSMKSPGSETGNLSCRGVAKYTGLISRVSYQCWRWTVQASTSHLYTTTFIVFGGMSMLQTFIIYILDHEGLYLTILLHSNTKIKYYEEACSC
jgi:hypothetical protein